MVYLDKYLKVRNDRLAHQHRPKEKRILRGERRKHVVNEIFDVLKDWRYSKFENEGPAHHGLRAALCLDGFRWGSADLESDLIVQEGLRRLGAKRPSYDEGQWHYTVAPEQCVWCLGAIDETDQARGFRFCSPVCANSAYEHREYQHTRKFDSSAQNAYLVIRTDEAPAIACGYCGVSFKKRGAKFQSNIVRGRYQFCSKVCADKSRIIYADRKCAVCEKTFRPTKETTLCCSTKCGHEFQIKPPNRTCRCCGKGFRFYKANSDPTRGFYCSRACKSAGGPVVRFPRECAFCGTAFLAKSQKGRCCSDKCAVYANKLRVGTIRPKTMTPAVLDFIFRECGARVTMTAPNVVTIITAEIFDGWFKRAA